MLRYSYLLAGLLGSLVLFTCAAATAEAPKDVSSAGNICFRGTVSANSNGNITVSGLVLSLDKQAVLFLENGSKAKATDLSAGTYLILSAQQKKDGSWVLKRAQIQTPDEADLDLEAIGRITAISSDSVTVNSLVFGLNAQTAYFKSGGAAGVLAHFKVGDTVQVGGSLAGGSWLASELSLDTESCQIPQPRGKPAK